MWKYVCFLFLASLFFLEAGGAKPAENCDVLLGSCAYYRCLEEKLQCGSDGYLMGFAHKYCERSMNTLPQRMESSQSEQWIFKTSLCLQKRISDGSLAENSSRPSCHKLQKDAYSSHSTCYVSSGFCELKFKEKLAVLNSIKAEAFSLRAWGQFFEIIDKCLKSKNTAVSI